MWMTMKPSLDNSKISHNTNKWVNSTETNKACSQPIVNPITSSSNNNSNSSINILSINKIQIMAENSLLKGWIMLIASLPLELNHTLSNHKWATKEYLAECLVVEVFFQCHNWIIISRTDNKTVSLMIERIIIIAVVNFKTALIRSKIKSVEAREDKTTKILGTCNETKQILNKKEWN